MTYYAFDVGMVTLGIAFILFCVHTTLLAAGRRQVAVTAGAAGAAAAGGTTTTTVSGGESGVSTSAGNIAQVFTWAAFVLIAVGLVVRAYLVGRGPWGNLYEFSVAFAFGIIGGYLFLSRRYEIKSIAFIPIGVAFFLLTYAFT